MTKDKQNDSNGSGKVSERQDAVREGVDERSTDGDLSGGHKASLDSAGREIPDSRRPRLPIGFKKPESLAEQVQRLVRTHLSEHAQEQGAESFEDADDFDIDDDDSDPFSPYEMDFDPVLGREVSPEMLNNEPEQWRETYVRAALVDPETIAAAEKAYQEKKYKQQTQQSVASAAPHPGPGADETTKGAEKAPLQKPAGTS